ncbi:MAG: hypothetical protein DHS20C13_26160 [Thermodesulfobacteriota bacterium]|nr:MAG: hypothetical protein DHS20C13_26160 [Thermodesulfobacteriota bacterium]
MKENCLLYESIKGEGDAVSLKCVMCQSGYTMNKEGVCKLSELSDQAPDTTDDSVPEKEFINIRLCQFFFLNVFLQFFF